MRRFVVWAVFMLGCLAPVSARDRDAVSRLPPLLPEPNELQAEVPRGGPVWITLSAYSLTSPVIRYRIKDKPEGTIGAPELLPDGRARVRYEPPQGNGPGTDSFTYEVQSGAGVSSAAEVHIKLTDTDPQLTAPTEIDFGEVLPGRIARRTIDVQNIGGGLAEGEIRVPEGWSVEGDPSYSIPRGGKQTFIIVFQPAEQRQYLGDVSFTSDLELATDLVGKEVPPISVAPGPIELSQAGSIRLGAIEVQNRTDAVQTLSVAPGSQLDADASIQVPADGTSQIIVRAKAGVKGVIDDTVVVTGSGLSVQVPVHGFALQPAPVYLPATAVASVTPRAVTAAASQRQMVPPVAAAAPAPPQMADLLLPAPPAENYDLTNITRFCPLYVTKIGRNSAELTCDFSNAPAARGYRVEAESIVLDEQNHAQAKWDSMDGATVSLNGGTVTATLDGLAAGGAYVVRIVGLDAGGTIVSASSVVQVRTPVPEKHSRMLWEILGLAVVAGIGIWLWRRRQATA